MKKLLLAAAALIAVPAVAQPAPPPPPGVAGDGAAQGMGERVQRRDQVVQRTQRMFAMLDANHDGVLDQSELAAAGSRWDGAGGASAHTPMDRNAMFDMIDTNHDGMISRDEFARAPMHGGESGGMAAAGRGMGGRGMAQMWAMADANHDGRVTLQEATEMALRHFDMLDTNHDGLLTPDERAAGRMQMQRGQ